MSSPVPSPVRFIISNSAAVSGRVYPFSRAKITEVRSLWVCSIGPTSMSSTMACSAQPCGVSPIFSCSDHSSGTERAIATICFSTCDLGVHRLARRARKLRGAVAQHLHKQRAPLGDQFDAVGGEELVVADRGRDRVRAGPP